jgi:micrococcal nuclease
MELEALSPGRYDSLVRRFVVQFAAMKKKHLSLIGFLLFLVAFGWFYSHLYKVNKVIDGDTIHVVTFFQQPNYRLAGIDAPERSQEGGKASTARLKELIGDSYVFIQVGANGKFGRPSVKIYTLPFFTSVNREMVAEGQAWHYKQYSDDEYLGVLEERARKKHLGLWVKKNPTPPWEYRQAKLKGK